MGAGRRTELGDQLVAHAHGHEPGELVTLGLGHADGGVAGTDQLPGAGGSWCRTRSSDDPSVTARRAADSAARTAPVASGSYDDILAATVRRPSCFTVRTRDAGTSQEPWRAEAVALAGASSKRSGQ